MKSKIAALLALLLPPVAAKSALLRMLGWRIGRNVRIGFSWLRVEMLRADDDARIGSLNYVSANFVVLSKQAAIGHMNCINGPLGLILRDEAAVGNRNKIKRASHPIVWGHSALVLGKLSKVTANHLVDCTRPVRFGDYTTLAGAGSQLWTHAYLHAPNGRDRVRIDGVIRIDDNVYIGSCCVIQGGVRIVSGVSVGANSTVSKSLSSPGLYVGQALRHFTYDYHKRVAEGRGPNVSKLGEKVLVKKPG